MAANQPQRPAANLLNQKVCGDDASYSIRVSVSRHKIINVSSQPTHSLSLAHTLAMHALDT
eukprot:572011-Prorocentrum_lima.AAC.1